MISKRNIPFPQDGSNIFLSRQFLKSIAELTLLIIPI